MDDPSAWPDLFSTEAEQDAERQRIFGIIEAMVPWEASNVQGSELDWEQKIVRSRGGGAGAPGH